MCQTFLLVVADRDGHARAEMLGQLHSDMPHAAGAAMDQDGLPGLQIGALDQRFPCGDQHQRQSGDVLQADIGGGSRAIFFMHRGVFGITARLVA